MGMQNIEKVIKGPEICSAGEWCSMGGRDHTDCPYYPAGYTGCTCKLLIRDALALMKAQRPRVMSLEEMNDMRGRGKAIYYEDRDASVKSQDVFFITSDKEFDDVWLIAETYMFTAKMSAMGKTWRCWTSCPTDEQREAMKWDE